jgi:SAM-dependent methyltransferase
MSRLTQVLRGRLGVLSGRPEDVWRELIAHYVSGKSLIDVGCMWRVNGAYAFHALDHGARRVVGLDTLPPSAEFERENATHGNRVQFVQGDVNDGSIVDHLGAFDVVFCSGVLYHAPNPLHTLGQLRRLCAETLILTTATTTERETPNTALFLPFLDARSRERFRFWTPGMAKRALDTEFDPQKEYGNWFWLPTPSCVSAMLRATGFHVRERFAFRHVTTLVAAPADVAPFLACP